MSAKSLDGLRMQLDKIRNVSSCQVTQQTGESRVALPPLWDGAKAIQGGVNITPNHQHSKSQPCSVQELEETDTQFIQPKCTLCFLFAQHLVLGCSTMEKLLRSHRKVTAHKDVLLLVTKFVLMALSHRFADMILTGTREPQQDPKQLLGIKKTSNFAQIYRGWATWSQTQQQHNNNNLDPCPRCSIQ